MSYKRISPQPVVEGGTGAQSFTAHGLLVGESTSAINAISAGATGTVLAGSTGADPSFTATPSVTSITIMNAPTAGTDGTNKTYVDLLAGGFSFKNTTSAATTADLSVIYVNGVAGVGATLTNAGANAAFSIDGVTPAATSRVLIKDQSAQLQNGIYTVTVEGDGSTPWVLTRATDYDQASEIQPGNLVPVTNGTVNSGTIWLQTATVTTIGTDPIIFVKFLGQGIATLTGDSGSATGTAVNLQGGNNIATSASGSTVVIDVDGTTQYNVQVGSASGALASVAPSATSGVPLISQGAAANPAFGTAVVAGGGTGVVTMTTAFAPVCSGTVATGPLQVASTGLATSGFILTSTGAASLPTFQAPAASSISITGNSGGALTGNSFTFTGGTTGLTFAGAGTTETLGGTLNVANGGTGAVSLTGVLTGNGTSAITANAVTQYGTVIAGASNAVSSVAPSATSGVPYISQGAASNPTFGTAVVAGGGTGNTTFTAFSVIAAGVTAQAAFQNVSGVGSLNQVLTSQGAGALPQWVTPAAGGTTWTVETTNITNAVVGHGYFANKAGTLTIGLPTTSAVGDVIEVININTATGTQFTQAANQQIFFSTASTTLGATGTLTSSAIGDTIKLVCRTANLVWWATGPVGNWTPA